MKRTAVHTSAGHAASGNTQLVSALDAPKGFRDLLDAKWKGKLVKAHPGYSGTILTSTFQTARELGWDYFEKLAAQQVMQVQSSTDPPRKVTAGERPVIRSLGMPRSTPAQNARPSARSTTERTESSNLSASAIVPS